MEAAMTTTNPQIATRQHDMLMHHARARSDAPARPEPCLAVAARRPDTDPCDIACEAMPGFVMGDLDRPDMSWVLAHTAECRYCANMLDRYERLDSVLDRLGEVNQTPPPAVVPGPRATYTKLQTPVGSLFVASSERGVCEIGFATGHSEEEFRHLLERRGLWPQRDDHAVAPVTEQLKEYFAGRRSQFQVPLDFSGLSPFTRSVLDATAEVPFGQVQTYRQIAERIGRPRATRAVGNALHRNPIPLIVPCHRIVRSDLSLGGYAGGVSMKEQLLRLEGAHIG
jgi:methylated-DNA-[protein]-cysteine S-methyltransferase